MTNPSSMKLAPMGNTDNRYAYLRCHNKDDNEFVCVRQPNYFDQRNWLSHRFDTVTVRDGTLPEWRLYHVVPNHS